MTPHSPIRNPLSTMWKWLPLFCGFLLIGLFAGAAPAPRPALPAKAAPALAKKKKKKAKKTVSVAKKHRGPIQTLPDADRTTEIQSALARGGYYQGDPTGKWDGETVAAVQKFQSANGLNGDGKLDASTLQKLGLGSEIAGVSAPRVPAAAPPSASLSATPAGNAAPAGVASPAATGAAPAAAIGASAAPPTSN